MWHSTAPAATVKDQLLLGGSVGSSKDQEHSGSDSGRCSVRVQGREEGSRVEILAMDSTGDRDRAGGKT